MTQQEKLTAAVAEYLRRLQFNNLSPKTIGNYQTVLDRFAAFCAEQPDTDDLYALVERWRDVLLTGGAAVSTVRQYLTDLNIFFERASKRSFPALLRFPENPVDEDLLPKQVKRPYDEIMTDEQVALLYRNEPPRHYEATWARNYAMIQLCLNEKIRNAELLDLRLSDLDFIHHELTVENGKGRKFRVVDLTDLTEEAIRQYLNSGLRPAYLSDDDYLFGTTSTHERGAVQNRNGAERWHRGTTQFLSQAIERTVKAVTGVGGVRSHDLRHIGSRINLNAGQSMEELQGQLGHSSINTTAIYANRLLQRRRRDSAKAVLSARDTAAEQLRRENEAEQTEQTVIRLFA